MCGPCFVSTQSEFFLHVCKLVYNCLLVYTNVDIREYLFVHLYACVYLCKHVYTCVYLCKPLYTCVYVCKLVNTW